MKNRHLHQIKHLKVVDIYFWVCLPICGWTEQLTRKFLMYSYFRCHSFTCHAGSHPLQAQYVPHKSLTNPTISHTNNSASSAFLSIYPIFSIIFDNPCNCWRDVLLANVYLFGVGNKGIQLSHGLRPTPLLPSPPCLPSPVAPPWPSQPRRRPPPGHDPPGENKWDPSFHCKKLGNLFEIRPHCFGGEGVLIGVQNGHTKCSSHI